MNRYIFIFLLTFWIPFTFQVKQSVGMSKEEEQLSKITAYKKKSLWTYEEPDKMGYAYVTIDSPCVHVQRTRKTGYEVCPTPNIEKKMLAIRAASLTPQRVIIEVTFNEEIQKCHFVFDMPEKNFCTKHGKFSDLFTVKKHRSPTTVNTDLLEKLRVLISDYNYTTKQRDITAYLLRSEQAVYVKYNGVVKKYDQFDILDELSRENDSFSPYINQIFIDGDNVFIDWLFQIAVCKINAKKDTITCWKVGPGYDPYDEIYYDYDTPDMTIEKLP